MPGTAITTERLGPHGDIGTETVTSGEFVSGLEAATAAPMMPPEIKFSPEDEQRLLNYLSQEIDQATWERKRWLQKLARLHEKYRAPFPEDPKDWPIKNASQITIPIIKTAVDTTTSRIFQTLASADPIVSVRTEEKDDLIMSAVFDYERFLDIYSREKLDIHEVLDSWTTETVLQGTGILEVTTALDRRSLISFDPTTGEYNKETIDRHSGPIIYHIPLADFWIRPAYVDLQTAPWCGKAFRMSWSEVKDAALSGKFNKEVIDRIWRFELGIGRGDEIPETLTTEEKISKLDPYNRHLYRIFELAVRWDVDGDGIEEEILVYYHHSSRTLLRAKFNTFRHGRRPWRKAVYKKIPHWFYGEGLAEMLEHLQEEISTIHNQRLDNATIANLRIILVRELIKGLRPGDRLWTGKIVKVANVRESVGTLQLGEIYPSTVTNEQIALQYVERLSGIGEAAAGTQKPVSRTTATAQMALLEELNRRFVKAVMGMRRTEKRVFDDLNDLFVSHGTGGLAELWLGPVSGRRVESLLSMPSGVLDRLYKIQIIETKSTVNKEVELQTQIAVFQLIIQLWQQVRGEAAALAPQLIPVLAHEMVKSLLPVYRKIMQYADAPDPDSAISVLSVLTRILPAPEDMGGMGGAEAAENMAALTGALGGVGGAPGAEGNGGRPQRAEEAEEYSRLAGFLGEVG